MTVTVIDDEPLALKAAVSAVGEALPEAEIHSFSKSAELLEFAASRPVDIAFLDINMRGVTGLEVAEKMKALCPTVNIIFVTGYDGYKSEAMDLHASGYLMKPIVARDVAEEMRFLRFPVRTQSRVRVRCFGNFSVEVDGRPLRFSYSRTEELFAYLIDRRGAPVNYGELSAILWEDDAHLPYLKRLRADLINTFRAHGLSDVIISAKGSLAVDTGKISCDYYDHLNRSEGTENAFFGEYMTQYSWAENTLGALLSR